MGMVLFYYQTRLEWAFNPLIVEIGVAVSALLPKVSYFCLFFKSREAVIGFVQDPIGRAY